MISDLPVVSSRNSKETWVEVFHSFHKIWSITIWSIVVCWWEETDEVEVEGIATIKFNDEVILNIWNSICGLESIENSIYSVDVEFGGYDIYNTRKNIT